MTVERDDYGEFHIRGTYDDGKPGWRTQVRLKGSDQDGPQDHEYRVVKGWFDGNVVQPEKEAILALIDSGTKNFP